LGGLTASLRRLFNLVAFRRQQTVAEMRPRGLPLLLSVVCLSVAAQAADHLGPFEVLHQWTRLDFDWASAAARQAALDSGVFKPDNCPLADVKAVDGEIFVTVPRWRDGIPASVNRVVMLENATAVLRPYPNWEMNEPNAAAADADGGAGGSPADCRGIQYAHVIEIDPLRRMWIVDSGKWGHFTRPNSHCPPKLIVWDMVEEKEVRRHVFPEEVVDKSAGSLMRGVVVDTSASDPEDWFAFIANTEAASLVIYSYRDDESWSVSHSSFQYESGALGITAGNGEQIALPMSIDSLAMSPHSASRQRLYYAALASFQFYSIETEMLKNRTQAEAATSDELAELITDEGARSSQSEGMTVSETGVMFYSVLNSNSIDQWNTSRAFSALDQVYKDDEKLQWVDSFGWDAGYLYFTSNKMQKVANNDIFESSDEVLYRLMRAKVGTAGYMGLYRPGKVVKAAGGAAARAATAVAVLLCALVAAMM